MALQTGQTQVFFSPTNVLVLHRIIEARDFMATKLLGGWTVKCEHDSVKGTYTVYWGA